MNDLTHTSAADLIAELVRRGWRLGKRDDGTEYLLEPAACAAARKADSPSQEGP